MAEQVETMQPIRLQASAAAFEVPRQFHAWIAQQLGFPAYYGNNLSALEDCLGDLGRPVHLDLQGLEGASDTMRIFYGKVLSIIARANAELEQA